MMENQIRVLLIDDTEDDRVLAMRQLTSEFPAVEPIEVGDAATLERALDEGGFDLVITDYRLRWSDGIQVLRAVRDRYPHRPVIMFTATGTEEIAVEAMKNGLDDYVIKNNHHLKRLPAAVRSVLEQTATRQRAEQLNARLASLLHQLNVGVFRCTVEGKLLEANDAFWRVLRMESEPATRPPTDEPLARARQQCANLFRQVLDTGETASADLSLQDAEGRSFWARITTTPVTSAGGDVVIEGLLEDVTDRKRVTEADRLQAEAAKRLAKLTPREYEVLQHVVKGRPNKAIAKRLRISEKTVEKHRFNLMHKLKVRSLPELIRLAVTAE